MDKEYRSRTERLLGTEVVKNLENTKVIIFGVGGVGSWAAESLIRSGVENLTIVDPDHVAKSNINRQLPAQISTVGEPKVEVLTKRFLDLNPAAVVTPMREVYSQETSGNFDLSSYDYIIDAIDSLKDKVLLIENATRSHATLFSSMGAALKLDPTKVAVAEFWKVKGCPLARALRQRFKKLDRYPAKKFKCVYSDELLPNLGKDDSSPAGMFDARKAAVNGSLMHITAIFGLTLAGLVIEDVVKKTSKSS